MTTEARTDQWFTYLSEILTTLTSTNQHEQVLHLIVDRLFRLTHCSTCAVVLIDMKTEYLRIDNFYGLSLTFCNAFHRTLATSSIGELLWTGNPVVIPDRDLQPKLSEEVQLERPFGSCICVQIAVDHQTLGYLHIDSREKNVFSQADVKLLQPFADLAGLALVKSRLYEENLRLDRIDRETGLEKYGPFIERANAAMERAVQFKEHFAFMILDIDNFKHTMNTYGYESSRQLLKEMGDLIKSRLRTIDSAGRYGFDEFGVIMTTTSLDEAVTVAETLRRTIEEKRFTKHQIQSTVSTGVAAYPECAHVTTDLILAAKGALFEAQRKGRNNVFSAGRR